MSARDATAGDGDTQAQAERERELAAEADAGEQAAGEQAAGVNGKPRRGDKGPRKRTKAKRTRPPADTPHLGGAALKASSKRLEAALAEVLVFPAVPAMMLAPDAESAAFLPQHFTQAGPRTAAALVAASETNPELRRVLERVAFGSGMFAVAFALAAYAAPPVLWMIGLRNQAAMMSMAAAMDESALAAAITAQQEEAQRAAAQAAHAGPAAGSPNVGDQGAAAASAAPHSL